MQTQRDVCVMLELGHRAWLRTEDTPGGDAYGRVVYVRGRETNDIQHFVEKVVFRLHERFPNPKRVCKEPPFQVEETGHGGLLVPIEVHFKNKEPPKKVCFTYDMFVHGEGEPPVKHLRCEKLTFYNPNKDFRRKLLRAGGVLVEPERDDVDRGEGPSEPKAPRKGDSSDR